MNRFQIVSAIFAASIIASLAPPAAAQMEIKQVAPGVYAALQPFANRFNDSNSTIIIGEDSVIVVDSQTTLTATRGVIEQIRKLTDKPVRYVINTHWHGDHVQGNQEYRAAFPGVQFIAQANTREDMSQRASAELKDQVEKLPAQIEEGHRQRQPRHRSPTPVSKSRHASVVVDRRPDGKVPGRS